MNDFNKLQKLLVQSNSNLSNGVISVGCKPFSTNKLFSTKTLILVDFVHTLDFRLAAALIRSRWVIVSDSKFEENAPKWLQIGSRDDSAGLAPYFDMLNHANEEDYNCNYFYKDDTG